MEVELEVEGGHDHFHQLTFEVSKDRYLDWDIDKIFLRYDLVRFKTGPKYRDVPTKRLLRELSLDLALKICLDRETVRRVREAAKAMEDSR